MTDQDKKEQKKQKRHKMQGDFDDLIKQARDYKEDNPADIHEKLRLLGEAKHLAGDLWAMWENEAKTAKSYKNEVINHVIVYGAVLPSDLPRYKGEVDPEELQPIKPQEAKTDKMRNAIAELVAKPYEDAENACASSSGHFKNKYESLTDQINILKRKYDHLKEVARGGV